MEIRLKSQLPAKGKQKRVRLNGHNDQNLEVPNDFRELSFLKLGTGVEEFLEGYQIFWPRFIGVSNILEKIVKYLMGCEIF